MPPCGQPGLADANNLHIEAIGAAATVSEMIRYYIFYKQYSLSYLPLEEKPVVPLLLHFFYKLCGRHVIRDK